MAGLEENLTAVRARIDAAARAAGRDPATVGLLAVSKTWPAADVRALAALGQHDFGENRVQELLDKAGELEGVALRWHFVGQLQRNKAAALVRTGAVVHSVDRTSLVTTLDRAGRSAGRPVEVFLQVDLGGPVGEAAARGGAQPGDVSRGSGSGGHGRGGTGRARRRGGTRPWAVAGRARAGRSGR
uniref:alanine racemase n=1 Tax=Blastococcus saxobsidens TaxID=138336 RepID=UPI001B808F80